MHRHPDSMHSSNDDDASPGDIEEFASRLDRTIHEGNRRLPGASALDPGLWARIQQDAPPARSRGANRTTPSNRPQTRLSMGTGVHEHGSSEFHPDRPFSRTGPIPSWKWHRGISAFLVMALTVCAIVFLPNRTDDQQEDAVVLHAPLVATPSPIDTEHCRVEPLTTNEVYALVIDMSLRDSADLRVLFPTLPPVGGDYPHTHTWLPEPDGTVRLADTSVRTRRPLPVEFQDVEASLDRYLRCQEDGTNFQLWALESPVEVQRQILRPLLENLEGNDEITEPMILEEIERLGPLPRQDEQYLTFTINRPPGAVNPQDGLKFEANPAIDDAYIAGSASGSATTHAWIGTQLVDKDTGKVVAHRGAALNAPVPTIDGGAIPMVGTFILVQDEATGAWLVEWFIPSV